MLEAPVSFSAGDRGRVVLHGVAAVEIVAAGQTNRLLWIGPVLVVTYAALCGSVIEAHKTFSFSRPRAARDTTPLGLSS